MSETITGRAELEEEGRMATLTIDGDPLAIRELADELADRNYLGSEFRVAIIEPDIPTLVSLMRAALDSFLDCADLLTEEGQAAYEALEAIEAATNA